MNDFGLFDVLSYQAALAAQRAAGVHNLVILFAALVALIVLSLFLALLTAASKINPEDARTAEQKRRMAEIEEMQASGAVLTQLTQDEYVALTQLVSEDDNGPIRAMIFAVQIVVWLTIAVVIVFGLCNTWNWLSIYHPDVAYAHTLLMRSLR